MKRKRVVVVALLLSLLLVVWGCPNGTAALISVSPNTIQTGSSNVPLTLIGKNFTTAAVVTWNGTEVGQLATTFVSGSKLTAIVPTAFVAKPGIATVMVFQSGQNQSVTQPLSITIGNVVPTLTGCAPCHVIVGAPATTITLTGTNFNSSSVVDWNTTALATTFVSSTSLTAVVPTALYTSAGTAKLTVVNGGTGGGTSASLTFTIVAPLSITTASLPGGNIGVAYSATLVAAGGTTPYTWSITAGTLPAGLTLNGSTGVISGTPTAAGSSSFTVQVTDATGALARRVIK